MKRWTIAAALIVCACVVLAAERDDAKYTETAEKTAAELRVRIQAAANALTNHPWAGAYYCGDGLGVNVSMLLAPEAGYLFEWHGCLGLYDRNYGNVAETNGRIRLSFTFRNERKGFQGIAEEFVPVTWGERRYLIPADDVVGFCNDVNEGTEPRDAPHGSYLLHEGDEKKAAAGFPAVPEAYRSYLLALPITAEITSINSVTTRPSVCEWKFKDTTVTLNAGSDKGLRKGMELRGGTPANHFESVVITEVEDHKSRAVMTQVGEEEAEPKPGWRFSTQSPWAKEGRTTTP